jgi:hypothetical protein
MKLKFEILDVEWAKKLEVGLEEYLMSLLESVDSGEDIDTESGIPYCGCDVCHTRETISYLTPRIIEGFTSQKVTV